MEAGRTLLSSPPSFPTRTPLKNSLPSSVLILREQATPAVTSIPTTSTAQHFPASVLLQEQRDEFRSLQNIFKEDRASQATLDRRKTEIRTSGHEGKDSDELDQLVQNFEYQLHHWPAYWNLLPPSLKGQNPSMSMTKQSVTTSTDKLNDVEPTDVINLAKRALSASKHAAFLADNFTDLDNLASTSSSSFSLEEVKIVRSRRHLVRQSLNRRVTKTKDMIFETYNSSSADVQKRLSAGFDPNDPLRLFLWGPETKQLLTAKEEFELIAQIQDLMNLEGVKNRLESQFGREPTLAEWAKAVGLSCAVLKLQLHSGNRSREKLINANLRMLNDIKIVVLAFRIYCRALRNSNRKLVADLPLMPYWWIRQTITKAIFQNSRTIRLPENVYGLLGKVMEAKRSYIQEGNHHPTTEEVARRVGIAIDKLEKLLCFTRTPLSMQQTVWSDQTTTFQEITADTEIEIPDVSASKQLMRKHILGLLNILSLKERRIIRLRFGIEDGKQKSLSEIGSVFGLSKERVRQLESRALYKLKQCVGSHGLDAYAEILR
uniref:RNA polymerase sigma-70 domain-containing protein n=1 Tax=Salix viminalis TaxID=40686 RepID=A0A6N2KWJ1_SALVM